MGTTAVEVVRSRGRTGREMYWEPATIGPHFEWLDHDNIRILEGGLEGRSFRLVTDIRREAALIALHDGEHRVGEINIERNPPGRGVTLWDAGVREDLRGNGLCALMTYCIFRELLLAQREAFFKIRMVRLLKAGGGAIPAQNIGMGVVAARLGFTPELNVANLLRYQNITSMDVIPATESCPPALKVNLRTDPFALVAFVLAPDTMKPTSDFRTYLEIKNDDWRVREWAGEGRLFFNGNYVLRAPQVARFINRLACDREEFLLFHQRVRGL